MKMLIKILRELPWTLWSGWGSVASILLFVSLWDVGYHLYGELVLPSPLETFKTLVALLNDPGMQGHLTLTLKRASYGLLLALVLGSALGFLAGLFSTASLLSRPIVTILVGIPPIAWIVLAMIWFGLGEGTVLFTVVIASFPIVFVGALEGSRTIEGDTQEMCEAFGLSWFERLYHLYLPHLFSYLFPSYIAALGMSWKIVVMAELLSASDGIGAELAIARAQLDTPSALALVCMMVATLLIIEYVILEPIRREVQSWRD
ncbi:MAG: ABC transporter permease [Wolinella sp.]